jgi:hypothetical protein
MKIKFLLSLFLATALLFGGCKKDDDTPDNYFKYNGKTYKLDKGYQAYWGENDNGSHDWDAFFVTSSMQYSPTQFDFIGTGDMLYLDLNTSSANGFVNGTYTFASERGAFTFVDGVIGMGIDSSDESAGQYVNIIGGSVTISVNGSEVSFEFDLTAQNNIKITGKFKSSLTLM